MERASNGAIELSMEEEEELLMKPIIEHLPFVKLTILLLMLSLLLLLRLLTILLG